MDGGLADNPRAARLRRRPAGGDGQSGHSRRDGHRPAPAHRRSSSSTRARHRVSVSTRFRRGRGHCVAGTVGERADGSLSTASIAALQDMILERTLRQQLDADAARLGQGAKPYSDSWPAIEFHGRRRELRTPSRIRRACASYLQNHLPTSWSPCPKRRSTACAEWCAQVFATRRPFQQICGEPEGAAMSVPADTGLGAYTAR